MWLYTGSSRIYARTKLHDPNEHPLALRTERNTINEFRYICIGYHMSGEVISVLSLEGRYYNCRERSERGTIMISSRE